MQLYIFHEFREVYLKETHFETRSVCSAAAVLLLEDRYLSGSITFPVKNVGNFVQYII